MSFGIVFTPSLLYFYTPLSLILLNSITSMKKTLLFISAVMFAMMASAADKVTITVKNSLKSARAGEMVEVPFDQVQKKLGGAEQVIVTDADGKEIPSQVTYDGKLIFQVGVAAKGKSVYYAQAGTPQKYEAKVHGRQFPERKDDMAWENDLIAFRCYGPALQRSGERAWGNDVWNKRTSKLILEERFALELDADIAQASRKLRKMGKNELAEDLYYAVSYHVDHGNGMDCYKVGPTLGCGTAALLTNGGKDIAYPHCYVSYEILDRGPLRFTVRLAYAKENIEGQNVTEVRIISLDAGSHMTKAIVTYEGLNAAMPVATGIVIHNENPTAYVLNAQNGYMGYEDLGDPNQYKERFRAKLNKEFGKIYCGAVYPNKVNEIKYQEGENLPGACGHILGVSTYNPGTAYTYYFGSAWSRNPETSFHSLTDWEAYLSAFAQKVKAPLKVSVK